MAYSVPREVVDAFYRAYLSRDPQQIGEMIADDVEWFVAGPSDVMQMCGTWNGKAAVIDRFARLMPTLVKAVTLEIEKLLVDQDGSAMFGRISCIHVQSGRRICHRVAHLGQYRDGKLVSLRVMNDSLDAAEQYVGHPIPLTEEAPPMIDDLAVL